MVRAKNYETTSKFVKVTLRIPWPLFFPDTVYMWLWFCVNFVLLLIVMNYCRASFEIMTRIRQMVPLLYTINFSKLRFRDETTLISSKKCADLSSICEVRSYITEWPRFWPSLYATCCTCTVHTSANWYLKRKSTDRSVTT